MNASPEIVVKQTARIAIVMNLLRQIGILLGGCSLIVSLIARRDLPGLVDLMQSDALFPIVGAGVFVAASGASVWKTIHNEWIKRELDAQRRSAAAGDRP